MPTVCSYFVKPSTSTATESSIIAAIISPHFSEEEPAAQSKMLVQGHTVREWLNENLSPGGSNPTS